MCIRDRWKLDITEINLADASERLRDGTRLNERDQSLQEFCINAIFKKANPNPLFCWIHTIPYVLSKTIIKEITLL